MRDKFCTQFLYALQVLGADVHLNKTRFSVISDAVGKRERNFNYTLKKWIGITFPQRCCAILK